jgi:hypothetical protein
MCACLPALFVCSSVSELQLNVGEFGFLEERCFCKEHFKERYEELHGPKANEGEENREHETEAPKAKPRPIPRKQRESTEDKEKHEIAADDAPLPQPEEKCPEEQISSLKLEKQADSETAKPVRGRKPNRFKKAEIKKHEEQVKEITSHDETLNLLGDEKELLGSDGLQSSVTAAASQVAVDDLYVDWYCLS